LEIQDPRNIQKTIGWSPISPMVWIAPSGGVADAHPLVSALLYQHIWNRNINLGYFCFMFNQTKPYCQEGAKWVEEYGGCPYWSCKIHYIKFNTGSHSGNSLEASYDGSQVCFYIPDPWNNRWATGVTAKGYQPGYNTHPSTTFKIWRLYE
jgi:hypothetical protein